MMIKPEWQDYIFNPRVRLGVPLVIFVLASLMFLRYIFNRPVVFESRAKLWIQTKVAMNQQGMVSPFFNSPISTAAEVMKSSVVLTEAINELKNDLPENEVPSLADLRGIKILPVAETDVLEISYQHGQPKLAYEVVKCIVSGFIKVSSNQSATSAVQSRAFIEKQLNTTRQQHEEVAKQLKTFQESNKSIDIDAEKESLLSRLSTVREELRTAQMDLGITQTKLKTISEQLGISEANAKIMERASQDPELKQLSKKLSDYQLKLAEIKATAADESPKATRLKRSIERLRELVAERTRQLCGNVNLDAAQIPTGGKEDSREALVEELAKLHQEEAASKRRIDELQSSLTSLGALLRQIPSAQSKFSDLTRAEKVTSESVSEAEKNLMAAKLNEQQAEDTSNVQVIETPEIANKPESANGKKLFAVGETLLLVLCSALYYLLYFFDPHIYSAQRLSRLLSLPLAGGVEPGQFASSIASIPVLHTLRLKVQEWIGKGPVVVTSLDSADGKTSLIAGLALSYLTAGKQVLLIDANFDSPKLSQLFEVGISPGLTDYVRSADIRILDKLIAQPKPGLLLLPAGEIGAECILEGALLDELLNWAAKKADIVLIDTGAPTQAATLALITHIRKAIVVARLAHARIQSGKYLSSILRDKMVEAILIPSNIKDSALNDAQSESKYTEGSLTSATW